MPRAAPDVVPVDPLPQRAGDLEDALVVDLVFAEREELRDHDVLERHDLHADGLNLELLGALEHVAVDRAAGRVEDEVDEEVPVPGLVEPVFGWPLAPKAGL